MGRHRHSGTTTTTTTTRRGGAHRRPRRGARLLGTTAVLTVCAVTAASWLAPDAGEQEPSGPRGGVRADGGPARPGAGGAAAEEPPPGSGSASDAPPAAPGDGTTPGAVPAGTAPPPEPEPEPAATEAAEPSPTDEPEPGPEADVGGSAEASGGASGEDTGGDTGEAGPAAAVLALVNEERARAGCQPVTADEALARLAADFSRDMAERGFFSHTDPDGHTPWDRAEEAGVTHLAAENIARGQPDAEAVMAAWMNSEGHRANILNCDYRTLGVGIWQGEGGPWWTQEFGF